MDLAWNLQESMNYTHCKNIHTANKTKSCWSEWPVVTYFRLLELRFWQSWAFNQPLFRAKVRDHCHNFGKYKDPALRDCNFKGKLNQKIQHQRSSNPKAQYQTKSTYESHSTVKKLVFCTKSGSFCYIAVVYSGSATDRFITKDTNIAAQFTPGYSVLIDKGFHVQ